MIPISLPVNGLRSNVLGVQSADRRRLELLKQTYSHLNDAIRTSRFAQFKLWIQSHAAMDFSMRAPNGRLTDLNETINMMKSEFLVIKTVKASTLRLSNLAAHADHLSCTVSSHLDVITRDGKRLVEDTIAVDTWKPSSGDWKLSSIVTTKDQLIVNGKTVRRFGFNPGEATP